MHIILVHCKNFTTTNESCPTISVSTILTWIWAIQEVNPPTKMGTFTTSEEILGHIYHYCNRM